MRLGEAETVPRIRNPILRGSHPDPSILRVGDDYFIATSTFEWLPGVQIHHSRDLAHWRLVGHGLHRAAQLNLRGVPDSAGVWAPCLSHDGAQFHLVYPLVLERRWPVITVANYLVTAPHIEGPWSDPIFLSSSGWDPSLYHAEDGRKWLVSHALDVRRPEAAMAGILLQEYSPKQRALLGEPVKILDGSRLRDAEGPHLYRRGNYFYLMLASGGTGWDHAVSVARAEQLQGPYELDPTGPLLTAADDPTGPLQRVGHGSLVQTQTDEWFVAHLASRPVQPERRSILGRETVLSRVEWGEDGWLRTPNKIPHATLDVAAPALPIQPQPPGEVRDGFEAPTLAPVWNTLREWPEASWLDLSRQPSHLSLRGRAFLSSRFEQSLVARRVQSLQVRTQTCVDFDPATQQHMAGLVFIYDTADSFYLHVGADEQGRRVVAVLELDGGRLKVLDATAIVSNTRPIHLRAELDHRILRFAFSEDGVSFTAIGGDLDATRLSDEYREKYGFTGAFVGICAHDLERQARWAHFDYFDYGELSS